MTVKEVAREEVVTVTPGETANNVALTMKEEGVGSVVVVEDGEPTGIVTDRDLAMEIVGENADAAGLTVAEVMTERLFTVTENAGLYDVLSRMSDVGVRRVPVVDQSGKITGIVTLDDFVVLLSSEFNEAADIIKSESPPY